jgi:hypothetical protein
MAIKQLPHEYELQNRLLDLDPLAQRLTRQIRATLLEKAGFANITVKGGYTEAEATVEHDMLVFIARK